MTYTRKVLCLTFMNCCIVSSSIAGLPYNEQEFKNPPIQWHPVPLWFWNNTTIEGEHLTDELKQMINQDQYGGCAILPFGNDFRPGYLTDEYFTLYEKAIEQARQMGAQMSLYDEYGFPSGSMGAINGNGVKRFMANHPGKTIKRLDKTEYEVQPNSKYTLYLHQIKGNIMAVTAYDAENKTSKNLRSCIQNQQLEWEAPQNGKWRVMVFSCLTDGDPNVDYLDPEAVSLFIQDTHEQYNSHFPQAFGKTITSTFFDEPTLYRASGRIWTERFNQRFQELYGIEPDSLYPALWYDMGENTSMIRNMMFGTRAKLYAEGFMRTLAEWATQHGILSTGHQDQEEIQNPTSVAGDLMLDGKYMTMPGIDKIGGGRPTENFYKVVSSSANNWDHPQVMSETYGAMGNLPIEQMYQIAIDQYTKGITNLIPHAVWYNDGNVTFLPELSWRDDLYNKDLPAFNTFLARLKYMLGRPGRHVADIAVIYPIQTLQGGHYLDGELGYYEGGVKIPGTDYDQVSAILTDELGRDFTYLHPEVLDDRCSVGKDGTLTMKNRINTEHFHTIILPGMHVISMSNLRRIQQAWKRGAQIIFTTQTPSLSADPEATSQEIQSIISELLKSENVQFVTHPTKESLSEALDKAIRKPDVAFSGGHPLNYIHKVIGGKHVYYMGNIDNTETRVNIQLKEKLKNAQLMDPRTGDAKKANLITNKEGTQLKLDLQPQQSIFIVEK